MAKKSFSNSNPALAYMDKPVERTQAPVGGQLPFTTKPESKSRRLSLLIRPSTYRAIEQIARQNGASVNDTINAILESYTVSNEKA